MQKPGRLGAHLRLLSSIAIFEAGWFACVIGAARDAMAWGIAAVLGAIAWQVGTSRRRAIDITLMVVAICIGIAWDTVLARMQVVVYASPLPFAGFAPLWLLALWAQLGSVIREPMSWLHGRWWLAAPLGAVGGAASYAGAARLGACSFPDKVLAMQVLAAGWAVFMPLMAELARHLDARAARANPLR
jgi:hypothetical protein